MPDRPPRRPAGPLLLAIGAAWTLFFLVRTHFAIDGDESIIGLMATHIVDRRDFPIWFYGQEYMGSLEAWVAAPLVAILGPRAIALKLTAAAFWLGALAGTWTLAKRIFHRAPWATFTTLYLACGPMFLTVWSTKVRGGYVSIWALGTWLLVLAHEEGTETPTPRRSLALGFLAGLATWTNLLVFPYVFATLVWLAARRRLFQPRPFLYKTGGFLLGVSPLLVYNLLHHGATFRQLLGGEGTRDAALRNLGRFFAHGLPVLLGVVPPWNVPPHGLLKSPIAWILLGLLLAGTILLLARNRASFHHFLKPNPTDPPPTGLELYLLVVIAMLVGIAFSKYGSDFEPRFATVLYTAIAPLIVAVPATLYERGSAARTGAIAIMAVLLAANARSQLREDSRDLMQPVHYVQTGLRHPLEFEPFANDLENAGVDAVWGDYWMPTGLSYVTRERIASDSYRLTWHRERLEHAKRTALLLHPSPADEARFDLLRNAAKKGQIQLIEREGTLAVIPTDTGRPPPGALTASQPGIDAANDGLVGTRWTTTAAQRPGQWIELDLGRETLLDAILCVFGEHDEPRRLRLSLGDDQRHFATFADRVPPTLWYEPLRGRRARYLRLEQVGTSDRWWSVHEIRVFPTP